ncbi:MAG: inorganic phosphate transporter, partial [Oscillospiraceae bacterium]|nr:inorganic phosphate transporter [Oscillospiraceae bacterium]
LSTVLGFPVSTTHAKTMAMLGAGLCGNKSVGGGVLKDIVLTWILTFPGCILLGFSVTKIFLKIF